MSKQVGFLGRVNHANPINCILKHRRFDMPEGRNFSSGFVGCFLNNVTDVTLRPFPFHFVTRFRFIQALPPIVIRLAPKVPFHRLDHITGIGVNLNLTGFFQCFQTERGGGDFRLLICRLTEVGSERAP